jgi:tetratricopeptide (TPR) repeat protein
MLHLLTAIIVVISLFFLASPSKDLSQSLPQIIRPVTSTPTPPPLPKAPISHIIPQKLHVFQTFNNCGPASLSMQLSYFAVNASQKELGDRLRPYQNAAGDNDDKSVTLEELGQEAKNYDLISIHRPNGDIQILKDFISNGIPVVVRTWLKPDDLIGHYRVIRGYDDTTQEIIQDDSLQGKNLRYSYSQITDLWKAFNHEYLVLVKPDQLQLAQAIIGENMDFQIAWEKTAQSLLSELEKNPSDLYTNFNLSVAYYHLRDYQKSISYFERVDDKLPFRMLWYQIEPILAYYESGNFTTVRQMSREILNNHNRAFSEIYYLLGQIYLKENQPTQAKIEFEKAIFYNRNYSPAHTALESLQ